MKLFFIFIIVFSSCSQLPKKRTDKLSILQGVTTFKGVEFSIMAPKEKVIRFELRSAKGEILSPDETKIISRDFSPYVLHKIIFSRDSNNDYNLYAFENDKVIDQRLIGRGQIKEDKLRVAVASCMNDYYFQHFKIWDVLAASKPEYLLMIGDNVYTDKSSITQGIAVNPKSIWDRYTDIRLTLPLYYFEKLIPVHALWDDHDYGVNDGGEDFEHKDASREIFNAFYAQELSSEDWSRGFGVGGKLTLGDFNFYFLDARTFRSKQNEGKHFGQDQEHWLVQKLQEEAKPSFLIKGDQFFGGYHEYESFEKNHPANFSYFIGKLKLTKSPFIFLSGDRHMSEIMQFPRSLFDRPSFEITSSPIHAALHPGMSQTPTNPWRVVAEDSHVNFTIIDNQAVDSHWFLDVQTIGEEGRIFYRRELAVFIKDLQNNLNEARKRRHGQRRYRKKKK